VIDLRQSPKYVSYLRSINWKDYVVDGVYLFSKKFPLLGSYAKIQRPEKIIEIEKLSDFAGNKRITVLEIEPKDHKQYLYYKRMGFKSIKQISLPSKTIFINLKKSKNKLLSEMQSKSRYNIGLSSRKGVSVTTSRDIDTFSSFWQKNANARGMFLPHQKMIKNLFNSFGSDSVIFDAYYQEKMVASLMIVTTPEVAYYMYAASSKLGKNVFAPSLLVWEGITWAKKKGLKVFDFEGIYDERFPIETWKGFTRFKKGFGGNEVIYPQPLRKIFPKNFFRF